MPPTTPLFTATFLTLTLTTTITAFPLPDPPPPTSLSLPSTNLSTHFKSRIDRWAFFVGKAIGILTLLFATIGVIWFCYRRRVRARRRRIGDMMGLGIRRKRDGCKIEDGSRKSKEEKRDVCVEMEMEMGVREVREGK